LSAKSPLIYSALACIFSLSLTDADAYWRKHYVDGGWSFEGDDGSYIEQRPRSDGCWLTKKREKADAKMVTAVRCPVKRDRSDIGNDVKNVPLFLLDR